MYLQKKLRKLSFGVILYIYTLYLFYPVQAQTYSNEEIIISGLGFSRFGVTIAPEESFLEHPDSQRWLRIIDRNLCWSGVFMVTDSRYKNCRTRIASQVDMKVLLKLERKYADSGALISKNLMITFADND